MEDRVENNDNVELKNKTGVADSWRVSWADVVKNTTNQQGIEENSSTQEKKEHLNKCSFFSSKSINSRNQLSSKKK